MSLEAEVADFGEESRPEAATAPGASTQVMSWTVRIVTGVMGLTVFLGALNHFFLSHRLLWNTSIAGVEVGGNTVADARESIREEIAEFQRSDLILQTDKGDFSIQNADLGAHFDLEQALMEAFTHGHSEDPIENFESRFGSMFKSRTVALAPRVDAERFHALVTSRIPILKNDPPVDASVRYEDRKFTAYDGKPGMTFDAETAFDAYVSSVGELKPITIPIVIISKQPDVSLPSAVDAADLANSMSRRYLSMTYTYDGYNYDRWSLYLIEVRDWFEFRKTWDGETYGLSPVLNTEKLRNHLHRRIAPYMYLAKEDIRIENDNGTPKAVGIAKDGYYLNVRTSVVAINEALMAQKKDSVGNYVAILEVAHLVGGIENPENEFHISDVLATGVTDFFGSPANRKYNIAHASKRFQNILVEPGEKFSFVKNMGRVDSTTGYLKELVIVNGDSSEPQWGGGICQVSSTLFRTIFFSGLDITQRVNHSFEVKYYRPVGLDATVFDPSPDLRFLNDTEHLVLIQNYVDLKRTKMYFKLFGKKDGRRAMFEGPIYGGKMGAQNDRYQYTWHRTVEFKDGKKRRDTFHSYYKNKDLVKRYVPLDSVLYLDSLAKLARLKSDSLSRDSSSAVWPQENSN